MNPRDRKLLTILTVLVLAAMYIQNSHGQHGGHGGRGHRRGHRLRHGGRRPGGMHPDIHQAYLDVYQQRPTTQRIPIWAAFIPNIPSEEEVECHIEIVSLQRRGGRCIQLGGNTTRPFICQSGDQIEFSSYCEFQAQQQQQQAEQGQQED